MNYTLPWESNPRHFDHNPSTLPRRAFRLSVNHKSSCYYIYINLYLSILMNNTPLIVSTLHITIFEQHMVTSSNFLSNQFINVQTPPPPYLSALYPISTPVFRCGEGPICYDYNKLQTDFLPPRAPEISYVKCYKNVFQSPNVIKEVVLQNEFCECQWHDILIHFNGFYCKHDHLVFDILLWKTKHWLLHFICWWDGISDRQKNGQTDGWSDS